jgi:aryl-alcohol dehydrogenase-like predicted oxidoreductase
MELRVLGQGLEVSALGLGCMGFAGVAGQTAMYGVVDMAEAERTVDRALELGVTFFDTAEVYGPWANEELLARFLKGRKATIATKFGFNIDAQGKVNGVDSRPARVKSVCDAALKRLRVEVIDLYYQHRVDPAVPIEDTVGAMADLVRAGKVRFLGLSEASAATLRRAHAVHPITALQSEYSLWERTVVPYSPLGRGFLSGQAQRAEDLPEGDYRKLDPRYQGENFDANMKLVSVVQQVAGKHGATPAQVALAWLLAQGPDIVPIPGCKRRATLEDSLGALGVNLTVGDVAALNAAAPVGKTAGERYRPQMMQMVRI